MKFRITKNQPGGWSVSFLVFAFVISTVQRQIKEICEHYPDASPICYLGDDTTDEDAFGEIKKIKSGVGILVSDVPKASAANACICGNEIDLFLNFWLNEMTPKGEGYDVRR